MGPNEALKAFVINHRNYKAGRKRAFRMGRKEANKATDKESISKYTSSSRSSIPENK